jgi:hypothetical protein
MTNQRAQAYGRVVAFLDELAATKLQPGELERLRENVDILLFAAEGDESVRAAMTEIDTLIQHLVDCDRWTSERAQRLIDDIADCAPPGALQAA